MVKNMHIGRFETIEDTLNHAASEVSATVYPSN